MPIRFFPSTANYAANLPADHGLAAWAFSPELGTGLSTLSPAGTIFLSRIRRVPAQTITNIHILVTTAGGTLTSGQCFGALFTAAGALTSGGQTADQSVAWASTGEKTMALTTPYVNPTVSDLYVGLWYNGTTGPTLPRTGPAHALAGNFNLASPNFRFATANTGLTTTAPGNLGAQSAYFLYYWAALS